jgi:DNA polymerase III delta prime subunit
VSAQDEVVRTLKSSVASGQLQHLLFYGPPGTGKTSTILAFARDLFGCVCARGCLVGGALVWRAAPAALSVCARLSTLRACVLCSADLPRSRVMELNASDERGIEVCRWTAVRCAPRECRRDLWRAVVQVVRRKIKDFAQAACPRGGPTFKLLILDEADSLTQDAQAALRRTMEKYSRVTRFCFICNYVSRIIEPLSSRCAKFRFKPLDEGSMNARLQHIAECEGVALTPEARAVPCLCSHLWRRPRPALALV